MELEGQHVLVLGLGLSGRSAARFCAERGAHVLAADERPAEAVAGLDDLPADIECRLGDPFPALERFDLVVPSPGIPAHRWAGRARRAWGDIELCGRALRVPIVAVTGTNGKSTVVRLIEAMARGAGLRARAAGNLGVPALDLVGEPLDLAVLEVSSFQLESVDAFRPRTAVLLNLSPDHLDRHGDLDGYLAAKARIFARQGDGDCTILNADDPKLSGLRLPAGVERLEFRRGLPVDAGAWMDGQNAIVRRRGEQRNVAIGTLPAAIAHQQENVLAALLACASLDLDLDRAIGALAAFEALPHRFEHVATRAGVRYVDDSKATNPGAARHALGIADGPVVWIAGGRHKGGDLEPLRAALAGRVRRALLIGEAAATFHAAFSDDVECECVGDLAKAVERAAAIARPGDVVLLAPACASFDQFESFEDRGRRFREAVSALDTREVRS
jgi:UDP-N-acetylmuramoylalanine--D-glutamate ligase